MCKQTTRAIIIHDAAMAIVFFPVLQVAALDAEKLRLDPALIERPEGSLG